MEKTVRIAKETVSEEYKNMKIGDVVLFRIEDYPNSTYIRNIKSSSTLLKERMLEGKQWTTKVDHENKGILVTRVS